jgi:hypothetical protein
MHRNTADNFIFVLPTVLPIPSCDDISAQNYHNINHLHILLRMNIYVGNLSRQAGEVELRALFEQFGEVKSIKIIKDQESGEPKRVCLSWRCLIQSIRCKQAIRCAGIERISEQKIESKRSQSQKGLPFTTAFSNQYGYKKPV